jgi:hypothetical protein
MWLSFRGWESLLWFFIGLFSSAFICPIIGIKDVNDTSIIFIGVIFGLIEQIIYYLIKQRCSKLRVSLSNYLMEKGHNNNFQLARIKFPSKNLSNSELDEILTKQIDYSDILDTKLANRISRVVLLPAKEVILNYQLYILTKPVGKPICPFCKKQLKKSSYECPSCKRQIKESIN